MVDMHELETDRARILPFTEAHIPDVLEMFAEPDSNKFIAPLLYMDPNQWIDRLQENAVKNQQLQQYWSAYDKSTGEFIGTLNLNKFSDTPFDQVGLHLSRQFWNQGYGYEMCSELILYAFEVRKLVELHWVFEDGHDVSKKLALKLGFEPFTTMREEKFKLDLEIYRLPFFK